MQRGTELLEDIFESELHEARSDAHRRDLAERAAVDGRAGIAEVRVVESVVELGAELNVARFGWTRHFEFPAEREVGSALGRAEDDTYSAIAPSITVADGHR